MVKLFLPSADPKNILGMCQEQKSSQDSSIIQGPSTVPVKYCGLHPIQNFGILYSISEKLTLGTSPSLKNFSTKRFKL